MMHTGLTPDEIGVITEFVHGARPPRLDTQSLFALYQRPFWWAPCTLAERLHALPGVLVDAGRCAAEHVEKLGRVSRGRRKDVVLGAALDTVDVA
jgi:hypothetical protein